MLLHLYIHTFMCAMCMHMYMCIHCVLICACIHVLPIIVQAIAVEIKHDDKLKEGEEACFQVFQCVYMVMQQYSTHFQAALLYTNVFGQRRLRIHNLALSTSNGYGDIFRSCEINAIMNFFSKSSMLTCLLYDALQGKFASMHDRFVM